MEKKVCTNCNHSRILARFPKGKDVCCSCLMGGGPKDKKSFKPTKCRTPNAVANYASYIVNDLKASDY